MRCNSTAELLLAAADTGDGAGRLGPEGVFAQVEEVGTSKPEFRSGRNGVCDAGGVDKSSDNNPGAGLGD